MTAEISASRLFLLQLSDSALPIGGYSNSWGVETWVQNNTLCTAGEVARAVELLLRNSLAPQDGTACSLAWRFAQGNDAQQLRHLNEYLTASRWAPEPLTASLSMGQRLARLAFDNDWICRQMEQPCHHSVAFGWLASANRVSHFETVAAYLYASCAGLVSACVRLVPLGHTDGQRILTALRSIICGLAGDCLSRDLPDICSFAPLHEWACIEHESLYSRLYQS